VADTKGLLEDIAKYEDSWKTEKFNLLEKLTLDQNLTVMGNSVILKQIRDELVHINRNIVDIENLLRDKF
jgi:hypothetical protein